MTQAVEQSLMSSIERANLHRRPRLLELLNVPGVEVRLGGSGIAGDLRRIYEVRHEIAKSTGHDSQRWREFVAVLRRREHGPPIRLLTVRAGEREVLAVLDGVSFEVLAELGPD